MSKDDKLHAIQLHSGATLQDPGEVCVECLICQAEVDIDRAVQFGCLHVFCESCICEYLTLKVTEAQVLSIGCPQHKCLVVLTEERVLRHLPPQLHEKFRVFRMKSELSKDPHMRWCPRPNCEGYCSGSSSKKHLTCGVCLFEYCYYCSEAWHGQEPCKEDADELLDAWARENNIRYCPNCRLRIERMMGCSHMKCSQCHYQWCWLCGEQWLGGHFAECTEFRRWWLNPPVFVILLCLSGPFTLVFLNLFVLGLIGLSMGIQQENSYLSTLTRNRCTAIASLFVISVLFSPLTLLILIGSVSFSSALNIGYRFKSKKLVYVAVPLLIPLTLALILVALALASAGLVLSGVVLTCTKTCVLLKRCWARGAEPSQRYSSLW